MHCVVYLDNSLLILPSWYDKMRRRRHFKNTSEHVRQDRQSDRMLSEFLTVVISKMYKII